MKRYQRNTLAICIFAFAFIILYEARGERLVSWDAQPAAPSMQHYWEQVTAATAILGIGVLLIAGFMRVSTHVPFSHLELAAYALGIGLLIGTAVVSWSRVREYTAQTDPPIAPPLSALHSAA
jgi:hypothetical protein